MLRSVRDRWLEVQDLRVQGFDRCWVGGLSMLWFRLEPGSDLRDSAEPLQLGFKRDCRMI